MKHKTILASALLLIVFFALINVVTFTKAEGTATGTISAIFQDSGTNMLTIGPLSDLSVGEQFSVDLKIAGASHVWAWAVTLNWNSGVIELVEATEGHDFLKKTPTSSTLFLCSNSLLWDQLAGAILGNAASVRLSPSATALSSGTLATFTFKVVGYGTSEISLSNGSVFDTNSIETVAPVNNATLTVTSTETTYEFVVNSPYGRTNPYISYAGITRYLPNTIINCSAPSSLIIYRQENGTSHKILCTCTGWIGTGSVPATGTTTNVSFAIAEDSSLTWTWQEKDITHGGGPVPTPTPTPTPVPSADPSQYPTGTISATFSETGTDHLNLPSTSIGTRIIVDLNISNAKNVEMWDCDLQWNPVVLKLVEIVEDNSFLGSNPQSETYFVGLSGEFWSNETGVVHNGIGGGRITFGPTTNTEGALCHLIFEVVGVGNGDITLDNAFVGLLETDDPIYVDVPANSPQLVVSSSLVLPEYDLSALAALLTCFVAFIGFALKKSLKLSRFDFAKKKIC
jgi:hypothetical protein